MPDTPEQLARQKIDAQLVACGWVVQDKNVINLSASRGVAVCELSFATGEPDYTLFVDGKALGTVEAKPEGHSLVGVEEQSTKYVSGVPFGLAWVLEKFLPKPLAWGAVIGAVIGVPLSWIAQTPNAHVPTLDSYLQCIVNYLGVWGSQNWEGFLDFVWPQMIIVCALTTAAGIGVAWWISQKKIDAVAVV